MRDVRAAAVAVRNALQNMETGQRGFVLTGTESYLEPYQAGLQELDAALPRLRELITTYLPQQSANVVQLQTDIDAKKAELADTIELRRQGRTDEAVAIVGTDVGKAAMDRARDLLASIIGVADIRLAESIATQRDNTRALRWTVILGGIVILVVGGGAVVLALVTVRVDEILLATGRADSAWIFGGGTEGFAEGGVGVDRCG